MARQVQVEIVGDSKKFTKSLDDATKSSNSFGSKFDISKGMVIAAGAAIVTGLVAVGAEVYKMGASFEAMDNKAQTVFGDSLGLVQKWASENAHNMGLTERSAIGLAASMGDLLVPMGFTRDAAAEMSTNIVGLSGALAEWSGGTKSASEVSDILTKALLGERDGLKALGISISEADVKQQLIKDGTDKLTGAALEQAKALATQTLIMNKSKDAQDAYNDGSAKGLRASAQLSAQFAEVGETLTEALYPILTEVVGWLAANLPKAIAFAKAAFTAMKPTLEVIVMVLGKIIEVIGKVITTAVQMATKVVKAAQDIVAFFQQLPTRIGNAVRGLFDGIPRAFKSALNVLVGAWNRLGFTLGPFDLGPLGRIGPWTLSTPNLPYFHKGGIVPGPTGANVPIMAQAGEQVIPRNQVGRSVVINFYGPVYSDKRGIDELTRMVATRLRTVG